jgi:hypothetical protein
MVYRRYPWWTSIFNVYVGLTRCKMVAMTEERKLTLPELLEEGRRAGHRPTERLVHDWVAKGLLDHPSRRGLGKGGGRGSKAVWPESQSKLFLLLLKKRSGVRWVVTLTNVPVGIWLYFGDAYVPLAQVRRALQTYGDHHKRGSWKSAQLTAKEAVAQLGPDVNRSAAKELMQAIALGGFRGELDPKLKDRISDAYRRLVKDRPAMQPLVGGYVQIVEARLIATRRLSEIPSEDFQTARATHLQALSGYAEDQPWLAIRPDVWRLHQQRPDWEWRLNNACLHLLESLGRLLLSRERREPPQSP